MTDKEKKIRDDLMKHGLRLRYGYSIVKRKTKSIKKKSICLKAYCEEKLLTLFRKRSGEKNKII